LPGLSKRMFGSYASELQGALAVVLLRDASGRWNILYQALIPQATWFPIMVMDQPENLHRSSQPTVQPGRRSAGDLLPISNYARILFFPADAAYYGLHPRILAALQLRTGMSDVEGSQRCYRCCSERYRLKCRQPCTADSDWLQRLITYCKVQTLILHTYKSAEELWETNCMNPDGELTSIDCPYNTVGRMRAVTSMWKILPSRSRRNFL
jgi:hypothetical protein